MDWQCFSNGPLTDRNYRVIFILEASVDWGITLYQRPHHLALALGRLGCLVLYRTTGDGLVGFRQIGKNVWLANDRNVGSISGAVRSTYSTSLFADKNDLAEGMKNGFVAYEYIDHIDASISGGSSNLKRLLELKMAAFQNADLIVSSAKLLHEEAVKACGEERCILVPNGVDVAHYRDVAQSGSEVSPELRKFTQRHRHTVGYFGAIAPWLWYELLEEVSSMLPDVGFVFIGPDYSGCVPRLPRKSNVLYLGPINYEKLAAHAALFDACFIPFVKGDIARATSPLKLFEYFALEKPVVVTGEMMECVVYEEVFSGNNAAEFALAIQKALDVRHDIEFKLRLRSLADMNSWDVRAETYISKIEALNPGSRLVS
jgi:glycosyltransferase involved in cell wall biosynthesis